MKKPKFRSYETKRLIIRPFKLTDHKVFLESQDRMLPKQNKWDKEKLPPDRLTYEIFKKSIFKHRRHTKEDVHYLWNFFEKKSGRLVGFADIGTVSRDPHQMANVGWFIYNHERRKGFAREGIMKVIEAGLTDLRFHRLEAAIDLDNSASIKLAKSCGLHREGIKRHYWFQNNRWEDQMIFIAVPELWKKSRAK